MNIIEVEDQYYILASSSFSDSRTEVLKQGDSFCVFDLYGDILQLGQKSQGVYHHGTRFLSNLQLSIENKRPLLLSSNKSENNEIFSVDLTNPDFPDKNGEMELHGNLHILRRKFIQESVLYEQVKIKNFKEASISFKIVIKFAADYTDIFEVRGTPRPERGKLLDPEVDDNEISYSYLGLDNILRKTQIKFDIKPTELKSDEIGYNLNLEPKEVFDLNITYAFQIADKIPTVSSFERAIKTRNVYNRQVRKYSADIYTSNEQFNNWINRSKADMITMVTETKEGPYPYAGIPWYSTPFGRDGIITAFECLWVEPAVAQGVLRFCAYYQATEIDDFRDAQPGKIFHEKRGGEMANLNEIPFKLYYGTIDATPLFVNLAGAYYKRTNDLKTIREIWPNIEKAISWIDDYGDIDGDGYIEYATKSSKGLVNQGWKDSFDAISHEDGSLAKGSIALCEVQGYVYDAKLQAANMAYELDMPEKARKWEQEAEILKTNFNRDFWSESKNTFVLALDGDKKPCNVMTSNAGHCLFSGIANKKNAKKLSKSLLDDKMFTGWGIRTLGNREERFNPMSYHNGSVWPHDNAIIAYGLSRYGYQLEVFKILTGLFDTSAFSEERLPELFCGFPRRRGQGPTAYPVACSPQAWAVGSVFLMLQAVLGLEIDAKEKTIRLHQCKLPGFLSELTITNLSVEPGELIALQIREVQGEIVAKILNENANIKVEVLGK